LKIDNYTFEYVSDFLDDDFILPKDKTLIKPGIIYVLKEQFAWFKCPCGCGADIVLRIDDHKVFPSWNTSIENNLISFSPSILQLNGCKSHFFIKQGEVQWC